jgi:SAM-dependent methyltransferase
LRHRDDHIAPSPFVAAWLTRLHAQSRPPRRALDVAMGRGRHAVALAKGGFRTFGVDVRLDAIRSARASAVSERAHISAWCADLTEYRLPRAAFEVVVVVRYLQRDLLADIRAALTPEGFVVYETFTEAQRALGTGPTSPDHLLQAGELRAEFEPWEILFYEETSGPEALARIVARKPTA